MDITIIMFVVIAAILFIITIVNNKIDRKKFVQEITPYFGFLKEKDYDYLLKLKYGDEIDSTKMFNKRIKNAALAFVVAFAVIFLSNFGYIYLLLSLIIFFVVFKMDYIQLSGFKNLICTKLIYCYHII